ncbi:MAG: hypothetical protein ACR2PI_08705 [Hyphomicrobiaceae bacterium]
MQDAKRIDAFIERLNFTYGPEELLARFFFKAVNAAAERGVFLEFGTFSDLLEANKANSDSWMPLTTTFQEELGGVTDETGVVFLGRNASGEIVATQAARMFDWSCTNFKNEAESLRFFYASPERDKAPNESCLVTAPEAAQIGGRVALGGGIWYRPDFRRLQLGEIIPRMARAYAFTLWNYDSLIATITQANVAKSFDKRVGFRDVIPNSMVMRNSHTVPDGDLHLALARMTPMQLIDDMFGFLVDFDTGVEVGVDQRRAQ